MSPSTPSEESSVLPEALPPSKLGTKTYWDDFYSTEIENFASNPEDTGECWFSESGAEAKVVEFAEDLQPQKILDLGTGNGHLLFSLQDEGIQSEMLGIDYSAASIKLATTIAKSQGYSSTFKHVDFLSRPDWTTETFDLVLDKGTLDAIALSGLEYHGMPATEAYKRAVLPLIKQGGTFLITSCNFTESELAGLFGLEYEAIEYPRFEFGGQQGSTVISLAFKMK